MGLGAAALVYGAVTLLLFHNLLPGLATHLYPDLGDPLLNTAVLAWNAKRVPLTEPWWNFPSFAPLPGMTSLTEHLLPMYPVTTPVIWVTGNPVLAYHLVLRELLWQGWLPVTHGEASFFSGLTIAALAILGVVAMTRPVATRPFRWPRWVGGVALLAIVIGVARAGAGPYAWQIGVVPLPDFRPFRLFTFAVIALVIALFGTPRFREVWRSRNPWMFYAVPMDNGVIPRGALVLDVPLDRVDWNTRAQYRAVMGEYRSLNGYSGYVLPGFSALARDINDRRDRALDELHRRNTRYVLLASEQDPTLSPWIAGQPRAERVSRRGEFELHRLPELR